MLLDARHLGGLNSFKLAQAVTQTLALFATEMHEVHHNVSPYLIHWVSIDAYIQISCGRPVRGWREC
jgi:hypothetical protein